MLLLQPWGFNTFKKTLVRLLGDMQDSRLLREELTPTVDLRGQGGEREWERGRLVEWYLQRKGKEGSGEVSNSLRETPKVKSFILRHHSLFPRPPNPARVALGRSLAEDGTFHARGQSVPSVEIKVQEVQHKSWGSQYFPHPTSLHKISLAGEHRGGRSPRNINLGKRFMRVCSLKIPL